MAGCGPVPAQQGHRRRRDDKDSEHAHAVPADAVTAAPAGSQKRPQTPLTGLSQSKSARQHPVTIASTLAAVMAKDWTAEAWMPGPEHEPHPDGVGGHDGHFHHRDPTATEAGCLARTNRRWRSAGRRRWPDLRHQQDGGDAASRPTAKAPTAAAVTPTHTTPTDANAPAAARVSLPPRPSRCCGPAPHQEGKEVGRRAGQAHGQGLAAADPRPATLAARVNSAPLRTIAAR